MTDGIGKKTDTQINATERKSPEIDIHINCQLGQVVFAKVKRQLGGKKKAFSNKSFWDN